MEDVQIKLSALWIALMLTYLLRYASHSGHVVGNRDLNGDADCHGHPVADVE